MRILHCHSTFDAGGKERRCAQIINALGRDHEHTIIATRPGKLGARSLIAPGIQAQFPQDFPDANGAPWPGKLVTIAQALREFDLVCTYNWGAMNIVLAHSVFAKTLGLPPLIHHEDGFNEDEADGLKWRRNLLRRVALNRTDALIVPSLTLEKIALRQWQQPKSRLVRIDNGIDVRAFARKPKPKNLRLIKREGEKWVGTLAGLRAVKQLPSLVEAFHELPENWHLVIFGRGEEEAAIREAADRLEVSHRVHLPGAIEDPSSVIGLLDIFALSSRSEQAPLSLVEAMAAGLSIAAPDIGDIKAMVSPPNQRFISPAGNIEALAANLKLLAADADLRAELGAANKSKAREHYDEADMIARYREVYAQVSGKPV